MAITKERKKDLVDQYKSLLDSNTGMILTNYIGLSVKELEGLRRDIREAGGEFHVVKNTLVDLALKEAEIPMPENALDGPTAIGFASEDIVGVAKAIVDLSKESEFLVVKGAVIDGVSYNSQQVRRLAELPALPIVQAQLLGVLQAPANRIASILAGSVRQVVNVVKAFSESEAVA